MATGSLGIRGLIQLMIVLFTGAWILHGLSLLSGLISKVKVNSAFGSSGVFLLVFFLGGPLIAGGVFSTQLVERADRMTFYGISLPWLPVVLLYEIAVLFFVYLATRRRIAIGPHPPAVQAPGDRGTGHARGACSRWNLGSR